MASPITPPQFEAAKIAAGSNLCERLRKFFSLADLVWRWADYQMNDDGSPSDEFIADLTPGLAVPAGVMVPFAGSSAPSGWLLCNGQAVSRTTYASLFAAIGTLYGPGDGIATFNLPTMNDRVPVGISDTIPIASTGGAKTHTLATTEIPGHTHQVTPQTGGVAAGVDGTAHLVGTGSGSLGAATSGSTGGGQAHNNMQPYVGVYYIIKT